MGRRKIRNYKSKQYYEELLDKYFTEHRHEVIGYTLDKLGFANIESLQMAECNMYFGFDCGWVQLIPRNDEMIREWKLDNGSYDYKIFTRPPYNPQSTTVQRVQVEKAVRDLGLSDVLYVHTQLD